MPCFDNLLVIRIWEAKWFEITSVNQIKNENEDMICNLKVAATSTSSEHYVRVNISPSTFLF